MLVTNNLYFIFFFSELKHCSYEVFTISIKPCCSENIEVVHVFDFEEPQNEEAFKNTLSSMKKAAGIKRVKNITWDIVTIHLTCG